MPFDLDPKFLEVSPDLSKPSLAGLAWMLRRQPGDFTWDYYFRSRAMECGTVGCAIGLADRLWPQPWSPDANMTSPHAAKLFGIPLQVATALFTTPETYGFDRYADHGFNVAAWRSVTAEMVADKIDDYLAGRWRPDPVF